MIKSDTIYRRDAKGALRFWCYEVEGDKWRSVSGHVKCGATPIFTKWTVCKAKNVGRANEKLPEEQAMLEAEAEFFKKLAREYRRTEPELDSVPASPMLAQDYPDHKDKLVFPVYSQPKLDGIRCTIDKRGAFSRDYQPHYNVEHIVAHMKPLVDRYPSMTFDGELYNHKLRDDFNKISSIVRKQNVTDEDRELSRRVMQYHIYDAMTGDGTSFFDRFVLLNNIFREHWLIDHPVLCLVPTTICCHEQDLDEYYARYLEQGYEGQMVRINGPYERDRRSKLLLKRKELDTAEFKLLAIEEGVGNWSGAAKAFTVELPDGRTNGAGLRGDYDFASRILAEKDKYLGPNNQVTVEFHGLTPDGKLRFPRVVDFHPDGRKD